MLFMCAQCYLCALNVFYPEVPNKRPPLIIFGKSEPPSLRLLIFKNSPRYISKKELTECNFCLIKW